MDKPFGNCSQVGFKMREEGPSLFEITGWNGSWALFSRGVWLKKKQVKCCSGKWLWIKMRVPKSGWMWSSFHSKYGFPWVCYFASFGLLKTSIYRNLSFLWCLYLGHGTLHTFIDWGSMIFSWKKPTADLRRPWPLAASKGMLGVKGRHPSIFHKDVACNPPKILCIYHTCFYIDPLEKKHPPTHVVLRVICMMLWFIHQTYGCTKKISILYRQNAARHGQNGRLWFLGFLGLLCSSLEPKTSAMSLWTSGAVGCYVEVKLKVGDLRNLEKVVLEGMRNWLVSRNHGQK